MVTTDKNRNKVQWYRHTYRWCQANLTEIDPACCDLDFWRKYWKDARIQGIIVNAGGIVAYYPSSHKLQYRAQYLGDRDLLGEFTEAARRDGLAVMARMDSNRVFRDFYEAHPGWFSVNSAGEPYTSGEFYFTCINSDYYKVYIPDMLREIIALYHPDGFTDNSWTGIPRDSICYCDNCRKKFREECGDELPAARDWSDPVYRRWIKWSYACRLDNWDLFNKVTQQAGGSDCIWTGMVNANPLNSYSFPCDLKAIGERSKIMMSDHQSRDPLNGFEQNSLNGNLLHGLCGWDSPMLESMANYVRGGRFFRRSSNPAKETQKWMLEGFAGGISPWLHHIGAVQEDRRQFGNAPPVMRWNEENEAYLYDRLPAANVGLVWSQDNVEFYGREDASGRVEVPWRGFTRAMTRARIPFVPVHADHIERDADNLDVLILPDLAAMSDSQCNAVRRFVESGKSLVYTGATALLDEWGMERSEFPFEDITGVKCLHRMEGAAGKQSDSWDAMPTHNYARLPGEEGVRHQILAGFKDTDILPFGGQLQVVEPGDRMKAIATYIPAFPIYPPEFSWMHEPHTDIPMILAGTHDSGGRIVYFAGDIDRCYGRLNIPDQGDLLADAILWALSDKLPVKVEGPGYLDCRLYRRGAATILHLINLSGCNVTPGYVEEYLPVGPLSVSFRIAGAIPKYAYFKVSGGKSEPEIRDGWATVRIDSLENHEMIVLE